MTIPGLPADNWASGDAYEPFVGRWSRLVAREFLAWLAPGPGWTWADVGCGTGALAGQVLQDAAPARVAGLDPARAFLDLAARRLAGEGSGGPGSAAAAFALADARALPLADASVDAAVSALALNFVPDPARAAAEMARVVRPGGVCAAYVWDYAEGMTFLRLFWDAAAALDPAAAALDEGRRFPLCREERLGALWRGAGLEDVATRAIDVPTRFAGFDDVWLPFLGGQGPAPTYVAGLAPARRDALRDAYRAALAPHAGPGGAIPLRARAWAVRGRRPADAPA